VRIEVVVSPKGEVQVQTKGFVGAACLEASRSLELALGAKVHDQVTVEFHEAATDNQLRQDTR
jgi:hypothetical protein